MNAQDEPDCEKFRKGKFIFEPEEGEDYLIKRTRKKQIEIGLASGSKTIVDLEWLNECTYRLTYRNSIESDSLEKEGVPVIINIYKTEDDTCFFSTSGFDGFLVLEGKMRKVKRKEYRRKKNEIQN